MDNPIRMQAIFKGHVQGVGFRYTTVAVARRFDVSGYVRNLPDGNVELVAEGRPQEVRPFVSALSEEMSGYINDVVSHEAPPTGEFSTFSIRY